MSPSSGPHSLAAAAMSLMAVEISVALLPASKPKVWMHPHVTEYLFSPFLPLVLFAVRDV